MKSKENFPLMFRLLNLSGEIHSSFFDAGGRYVDVWNVDI